MTAEGATGGGERAEVRLERLGGLAWIIASNPGRMNALTADMWAAVPRLVAEAEADPEVRVILLRGAGDRAFSAGADISEFESARSGDSAKAYDALNHAAFEALRGATKPLLAMIHGFCLGGGLGLAACCDIRLADEKSEYAIPAARLGLGYNPRWIAPLLALARPTDVKELLFTGRRVTSSEARAMGLVNRVVPADRLEEEAVKLAEMIAANAPLSLRAAKLSVDEISRHPERPDMVKLDAAVEACFASEDYREGRRAFLEKRKPAFGGR